MTSLTYNKLKLLIRLHFPMAATRINREGVSLWPGGALMWLHGILKKSSWTKRKVLKLLNVVLC